MRCGPGTPPSSPVPAGPWSPAPRRRVTPRSLPPSSTANGTSSSGATAVRTMRPSHSRRLATGSNSLGMRRWPDESIHEHTTHVRQLRFGLALRLRHLQRSWSLPRRRTPSTRRHERRVQLDGAKRQIAMSGTKVVWVDHRSGTPQVYLYDLVTHQERQITTAAMAKLNPDIDGNRIVYLQETTPSRDVRRPACVQCDVVRHRARSRRHALHGRLHRSAHLWRPGALA